MLLKCVITMVGSVLFAGIPATLFGQDVDLVDEPEENRRFQPGVLVRRGDEEHLTDRIVIASSDDGTGVSWSGFVESEAEGGYRFAARFVGKLRVSLGGRIIIDQVAESPTWASSELIQLPYDWHPLQITLQPLANSTQVSLNVFWSGPGFRFEPIPAEHFGHAGKAKSDTNLLRGRNLVRALRCQACHRLGPRIDGPPLRSPDLANAYQNLREPWLRQFLSADGQQNGSVDTAWGRLHGRFHNETDVSGVIAFLSSLSETSPETITSSPGDAQRGRDLFLTLGCLACHKHNGLGTDNLFGGGDLTHISSKRPAGFVRRWLENPANVNADHRMADFQLAVDELSDLSAFLSVDTPSNTSQQDAVGNEDVEHGRQLVRKHQCARCHRIGSLANPKELTKIGESTSWANSCLKSDGMRQPNYGLDAKTDRDAIEQFVKGVSRPDRLAQTALLIEENSCFSCHAREASPGILPVVQQVVERHGSLLPQLPRMRPPSLNSVGDKLHDPALRAAITRQEPRHRDWLDTRMPKFPLTDAQINLIADYFVANDRVPDEAITNDNTLMSRDALQGADRLVTSDGFGCTSCHAIGKVEPPASTPLNQLGPSLSGLGTRIRRVWYDRWVRNPARIVAKMEMPSVQVGLPSLFGGDLDQQLTAVWQLLNVKGFQPPDPNPTRVVFRTGKPSEPAVVLTDVLRFGSSELIKPFLIGLPNRHNVLLDLEEGRLAGWWTGDTANQRTQGKSWFWEAPLFGIQVAPKHVEFVLLHDGTQHEPQRIGQFVTEADSWVRRNGGIELAHRLHFQLSASSDLHAVHITQRFIAEEGGFRRQIRARGLRREDAIALRSSGLESPQNPPDPQGLIRFAAQSDSFAALDLEYHSTEVIIPAGEVPGTPTKSTAQQLDVMPGFRVTRLPLRTDIMPTALAWKPSGELVVASLKGRVWEAKDTDGDKLEDTLRVISDDLAAPYGLFADDKFVDVLNKYGLIRLYDENGDGETDRHEVVASGWGHTSDYHDWVVGLPRDEKGNYYVAVPCQQDNRSAAAAHLRGKVLRLAPREQTTRDPRRYQLETLTGGHRFPMGIAINGSGEIFVSDNQGNYNPFNELNHIVQGSRYGFINKLERTTGFAPALTPPAIDIPHPWTRSVNGICFFATPAGMSEVLYGPFEGQLLGCEYDTRRLIRMSVEEVDGWFQGAAYPLAEAAANPEEGLQGPINCAIAPDGGIYIANIRDSGWGGANNTGSIVRIVPELQNLPAGIAEVKASRSGFRVEFTRPIDKSRAGDLANYEISSYRRISTPAYGGDDVDRQTERITRVDVADNAMSVELELERLRLGFVYEFRLRRLVRNEQEPFFPAEAFYTLRRRANH